MSATPEVHEASCSCGQLRARVAGPLGERISICHCLACQRRSGGPFGEQIRVDADRVRISGAATEWTRRAEDDGEARTFRFCPTCGSTVYYTFERRPDWVIVPVGAFADPSIGAPIRSVWESHRHGWVAVPESVGERMD